MPSEITINEIEYRIGQLNAKAQFHVARRLGPVIAKIGSLANGQTGAAPVAPQGEESNGAGNGAENAQAPTGIDQNTFFSTIVDAIAELSDKDCDYIIAVCMSVVSRRQGDRFMPCWNKAADMPQFSDIDLGALMQLTFAVIQDNLGGFMPAQPQAGLPTSITPLNTP